MPIVPEALYSVYALCDPMTDEVRYIGCSCNLTQRYRSHLADGRDNHVKWQWICALKQHGLRPKMVILEQNMSKHIALVRERYWLQVYLERGAFLTNMRDAELLPEECRK